MIFILTLNLLLAGDDATVSTTAAVATAVPLVEAATVQIECGTDLSSGVLVSKDGLVLTVAHGLQPDATQVTVRLASDDRLRATVLHQDRTVDVAVLKITETAARTFAFLKPAAATVEPRWPVLACGFPAREGNSASSVVRLGHVAGCDPVLIRSSCALTAGDSGGPLVNLTGQLLGIHQRIGLGRESNLHLTYTACRKAVATAVELSGPDPSADPDRKSPPPITVPAKSRQRWAMIAVTVLSRGDDRELAWGTRLNPDTVVTKLSRLATESNVLIRTHDDEKVSAVVIHQSLPLDLAVLKLARPVSTAEISTDAPALKNNGVLVFGDVQKTAGIVSRTNHQEASSPPKLGCGLLQDRARLIVEDVSANSAAADLGLQSGDVLLTLSGEDVSQLDRIGALLQSYQPGDWLAAAFQSGQRVQTGSARLRHSPSALLTRSEFLDGNAGTLSDRRTGFDGVLQHDAGLSAAHMGGPLCAMNGQLIGVNIARRSRESVLAIPIARVRRIVQEAPAAVEVP